MSASKVGAHIYVEGSGNTLASIYSDIADPLYFDDLGGSVYELVGNRYLYVRPGGELTIGDSGDYSVFERLQFSPTGNGLANFYVNHGGTLEVYGNIELRMGTGSFATRMTTYGKSFFRGNITYKPKITKFYQHYFGWNTESLADLDDIWDWENVVIEDAIGNQSVAFRFYTALPYMPVQHSFKNVAVNGFPGATGTQYRGSQPLSATEIYCNRGDRITFDNCSFERFFYGIILCHSNGLNLVNCKIKNNWLEGLLPRMPYGPKRYLSAHEPFDVKAGTDGQNLILIDGCTFENNYMIKSSQRDISVIQGSLVAIKDCTFLTEGTPVGAIYNGRVLIWTGNSFTGTIVNRTTAGAIFYAFALDLTIKDSVGVSVENAVIMIRQKDGKEVWTFSTDSSGKLITQPLLNGKIMLVHKEWISGDLVSGTFDFWSDDANTTYHDILIAASGYHKEERRVVMDQDRDMDITLQDLGTLPFV